MADDIGTGKQTRFVVGSAETCDIIISDSKVSKQHCELVWNDNAWHVQDLSSTNGTFVDGRKITQRCRLSPQSVVTLGRNVKLEIPSTLEVRNSIAGLPSSADRNQLGQLLNIRTTLYSGAIIAFCVLVIGLVGWLITHIGSTEGNVAHDQRGPTTTSQPSTTTSSQSSGPVVDGTTTINPQGATESTNPSPFWAILAVSSKDHSKRLVGNAVAVGPHRLVTLASITEAVEELKDHYPKLILAQHSSSKTLSPKRITYHPSYQPALESLKSFENDLNTRLDSVGNQLEPSLDESLDWSTRLETVMERIASVELASIECEEALQNFLAIHASNQEPIDGKFTLIGYPMILPNPEVSKNLETFLLTGKASALRDQQQGERLMVETSDFPGFPFISLACISQDSRLIGIVVRQPQDEGVSSKQTGKLVRVEEFWK